MDKTIVILLLCLLGCSAVFSVEMDIHGSESRRVLREKGSLTLTCHFDMGLQVILDYKVYWIHKPLTTENADEKTLSEQQTLVDEEGLAVHYAVDVKYQGDNTNVTLTIKDAVPSVDGMYICRAIPVKGGDTLEKQVEVLVPSDVSGVQMNFDGEEVREVSSVTVQRDEGSYGVTCSTSGYNPSASLQLFLGEQLLEAMQSGEELDPTGVQDSGARRFQTSASLDTLQLTADDSGKTLKCMAKADLDGAVEMVASLPLEIIALEPEIVCNENASGQPGDKYLRLTCRVNHHRVKVDYYSFEIVGTGEVISPTSESPNYHVVTVKPVEGMEYTDDVTLVLYEADKSHFATEYYLDVILKNGQRFRQMTSLEKKGTSGLAPKPVASLLVVVLSVLVWNL